MSDWNFQESHLTDEWTKVIEPMPVHPTPILQPVLSTEYGVVIIGVVSVRARVRITCITLSVIPVLPTEHCNAAMRTHHHRDLYQVG